MKIDFEAKLNITRELQLLPICLDYLEQIHKHFTNAVAQYLAVESVSDRVEDTKHFIEQSLAARANGTDLVWVIHYDEQFVGCCGIHGIPSKSPHFGIWLKEAGQGRGVGKQVVKYMLPWALNHLAIDFIRYPVDVQNKRSIRLIQSFGKKPYTHYPSSKNNRSQIAEYRFYREDLRKFSS